MSTNYFCSPFSERVRRQSKSLLIILKKDIQFKGQNVGSLSHDKYLNGVSGTLHLIRSLFKSGQHPGCEKSGRMVTFQFFIEE